MSDIATPATPTTQQRRILFVCTGNTCRSPLAEAICRKRLADKLGCAISELPQRGYLIMSAGVMAYPGDAASALAVDVAAELGADLSCHRSNPVNPAMLAEATHVFAMTRAHLLALTHRFPNLGPTPQLLCGDLDLPDPIGGELDDYRVCAAMIEQHLGKLIEEWLGS